METVKKIDFKKIYLNRKMVMAGVVDAQSGKHVILNSGNVIIPEFIEHEGQTCQIIGIANRNDIKEEGAFSNIFEITGVTFPESLVHIGDNAFYGCNHLTGTIKIPDQVKRIGKRAFYKVKQSTTSIKLAWARVNATDF
ncbi:hypothetical protein M2146_001025 [Lachnospiraceae bacterium PF1-22]